MGVKDGGVYCNRGEKAIRPPADCPLLDLARYIDKKIRVKYVGGREASGTLKGFDPLMNLVLDDTKEFLRGAISLALFYLFS